MSKQVTSKTSSAPRRRPAGAAAGGGADPAANPGYGVAQPLSVIFRWARVRLYDRLFDIASMEIERSALAILGTITIHGPMRTSELAQKIGLDRSTLSRQVAAAIASGYLVRDPDTKDARAAMLSLTDEGRRVQQKFAHAWHRLSMSMVADWSYRDQIEFVRLLSKLTTKLEKEIV